MVDTDLEQVATCSSCSRTAPPDSYSPNGRALGPGWVNPTGQTVLCTTCVLKALGLEIAEQVGEPNAATVASGWVVPDAAPETVETGQAFLNPFLGSADVQFLIDHHVPLHILGVSERPEHTTAEGKKFKAQWILTVGISLRTGGEELRSWGLTKNGGRDIDMERLQAFIRYLGEPGHAIIEEIDTGAMNPLRKLRWLASSAYAAASQRGILPGLVSRMQSEIAATGPGSVPEPHEVLPF